MKVEQERAQIKEAISQVRYVPLNVALKEDKRGKTKANIKKSLDEEQDVD